MRTNTSFRPTAYRDLHLGSAWDAYLNWMWAKRSGGEFVLIQDDLWMVLSQTWACLPPWLAVQRYTEDLTWLGLIPDRIEWGLEKPACPSETAAAKRARLEYNAWRSERHAWAAERLGYLPPVLCGELGILPMQMEVRTRPHSFGDFNPHTSQPPAVGEGQVFRHYLHFCGWYMACCVVDDVDFRIGAWVAGEDQMPYWAWCEDAFYRLGYNPPTMMFVPTLRRSLSPVKISQSVPETTQDSTIRNLRAAGYSPDEILETLRECSRRSWEAGHQSVVIPPGVLCCERKRTLKHRMRDLEREANLSGRKQSTAFEPEVVKLIEAEARRRLRRGTSAVRRFV